MYRCPIEHLYTQFILKIMIPPPDIRLHQVEHLPPFALSPVGIAQKNGRSRHTGRHKTGQEPFWIGFRQKDYRLSS